MRLIKTVVMAAVVSLVFWAARQYFQIPLPEVTLPIGMLNSEFALLGIIMGYWLSGD